MQKYMIHDLDKRLVHWINRNIDPKQNLLIFDDGLKSQFIFAQKLKRFQKIFAISPKFIERGSKLKPFTPKWSEYFKLSYVTYMDIVAKGYSVFMTLSDIENLLSEPDTTIALHGYSHDVVGLKCCNLPYALKLKSSYWNRHKIFPCYASKIAYCGFDIETNQFINETKLMSIIQQEIEMGLEWFYKHFHIQISLFVAPFNQLSNILDSVLKAYGLKDLSQNRIEL